MPACKCPKSISESWNTRALEDIEKWLRKQIQIYSINEQIHIGEIARESRSIGTIEKSGNSRGVRYLLEKLRKEGLVDYFDANHFVVKEKK